MQSDLDLTIDCIETFELKRFLHFLCPYYFILMKALLDGLNLVLNSLSSLSNFGSLGRNNSYIGCLYYICLRTRETTLANERHKSLSYVYY